MNKKILVLTMSPRQSNFEVTRLEDEAKKLGVELNRTLYKDLSFRLNNEGRTQGSAHTILAKGKEITSDNTMGVWCRVAGTTSGKYVEARNLAINLLNGQTQGSALTEKFVFCANDDGYLNWPRMGKIAQHAVFIKNDIPIIPTRIFYTKEQVLDYNFEFPVVCKHERGFQGKGVRKFKSAKQMKKWLSKMDEINLGMYLWQDCLSNTWDIRVIVIDGQAIGAMKRLANGDEFRSNFSLGGSVEVWDLSDEDKKLAEKVAKVCGLDYCGVDIMKDNQNNSVILEVNRQCQFMGFEKATGINVAKLVVEMFLKRQ